MTISIVTSWRERRAREFRRDGVDAGRSETPPRPGTSPSVFGTRDGGRTNRARDAVREEGGGAFVVCERIRRSSRGADRREASPREGDASRDVCRASVSFRPRRLHEVRGDGVARDACQSEPGRRVVRRAEREDDVVLPGRFGVARVGRAAAQGVGELLTRGDGDGLARGKGIGAGNGSISTRARWRIRDGTRHAIRTRSPRKSGAFSTPCDDGDETRRRRRDGMTETRWDDGGEMRRHVAMILKRILRR